MRPSSAPKINVQHVMIFGDPKSGKSTLVSELTKHGYKILWVAFDRGHGVIFKLPPECQENIELIIVQDTAENPLAIETANVIMTGAMVSLCDAHGAHNCSKCKMKKLPFTNVCVNDLGPEWIVFLDHMSQIADSATARVTKGKAEDYKLDYDDWRTQGNWMKKLLTNIQACDHHVICAAHVLEAENDEGKKKLVPEVGTRNFSVNSTKYFDHVVYCRVDNLKHRFGSSTTWMNNILTGSRTDVKIEDMGTASLLPIFQGLIKGQFDTENMNGGNTITFGEPKEGAAHVGGIPGDTKVSNGSAGSVVDSSIDASAAVASNNPASTSRETTEHTEELMSAMEEKIMPAVAGNSLDAVKARLAAMRGAK